MNPSQDFGAAFRAQRLAAGFTQAALAQRAGCRRQTIVAIEAGQNIELCTLLAALAAMGKELRIGDARGEREMDSARDTEQVMLERCRQIATMPGDAPRDQAEANVCRLAGMIVSIRYPEAGARLFGASTAYFADHPEQQVASAEVVRRGWIINAPRLHDRLEHLLAG